MIEINVLNLYPYSMVTIPYFVFKKNISLKIFMDLINHFFSYRYFLCIDDTAQKRTGKKNNRQKQLLSQRNNILGM